MFSFMTIVHSICFTGSQGCCLRIFFRRSEAQATFLGAQDKFSIINSGVGLGVGYEVNYGNLAEGSGSGKAILHDTLNGLISSKLLK